METSELLQKIINLPVISSGLAEEMLSGSLGQYSRDRGWNLTKPGIIRQAMI